MCEELTELRRATVSYCSRFEPQSVTPAQAARLVSEAKQIACAVSALLAHAAGRAAEAGSWKASGHRSAAEALAHETGTSVSWAREILEVGRRLQDQPEVDRAARKGELSSAQLQMITNATQADPSAGRRLLEEAHHGSLAVLKDACARTKAASEPDPEQKRKRIHDSRSLRSWSDLEGIWHLSACANPEDGAQIMSALRPITEALFHEARGRERRERPEAYALDALVELARESVSGSLSSPSKASRRKGPPLKLLVRAELTDLLEGARSGTKSVDLVGYGPISVSALEELLSNTSPLVASILTKAERIEGVAHLSRRPTAHQQSALEFLYPSCAAEACPSQARLEADHRIDWSRTKFTAFDLLDLLCPHHHDLKTRENWALVEGRGKRAFVAPEDPRHPRHKRRPEQVPGRGPPKRAE